MASVVVMSLKITRNQSGFGEHIQYRTILEDASGIQEKTPIKVAGINAGRIKNIELQGNKALITFELREDIKLNPDAKLRIKSVGLLGDKFLDMDLGTTEGERIPENTLIPAETGAGFDNLAADASAALKEVKDIAATIKEALKDENGNNVVKEIVFNIREMSESLKKITTGNEQRINKIIADIDDITSQLAHETDRYQKDSLMGDLSKIGPILDKVNTTVSDLNLIVADVKEGKGTVGKLLRDDAVVDQVSQTLSSVNRLVNRINNIEAEISIATGANTRFGAETRLEMDIFPAPERFFRLGIVTSDFGPELTQETRTETSVDGGPLSVTETRKRRTDELQFNLQIGRRIQRWRVRGGLIQSTGGIGIDYIFPDFGFLVGTDVFDYQKEAGPNVRLYSELRLWNVLYSRISGDDLLSKDGSQSATIFLGLRFTDQDLASLIGVLAR